MSQSRSAGSCPRVVSKIGAGDFVLDLDGDSAAADLGDHDVRFFLAGRAEDGSLALTQESLDAVGIAHEAAHLVEPLHALVALKEGDPKTYWSAQLVG